MGEQTDEAVDGSLGRIVVTEELDVCEAMEDGGHATFHGGVACAVLGGDLDVLGSEAVVVGVQSLGFACDNPCVENHLDEHVGGEACVAKSIPCRGELGGEPRDPIAKGWQPVKGCVRGEVTSNATPQLAPVGAGGSVESALHDEGQGSSFE